LAGILQISVASGAFLIIGAFSVAFSALNVIVDLY
jgi:hypothetical protein